MSLGNKTLTTSARRERIVGQLRALGSVQVNVLAADFNVSTVTIRNDLSFLEKQGVATRAYGGAMLCPAPVVEAERSIEAKRSENSTIKERIGKLAASLITPGSTIILDSGTTTYEIARQLRGHEDVIAMTNGMNVAEALLDAPGVDLLVTGGRLRRHSLSFFGSQAEISLQNYHFDMLFLGVDGLDPLMGVTTHNEDEARLNRCMCDASKKIIVVTDSSKFYRISLHKIISIDSVDKIITDSNISPSLLDIFTDKGIDVLLVDAE
ncbi:transcriptional repressor AgaR [Acerihabitans arboris]|uniref:DeoR family transcriptional regulator n=1 Tax=Acerihabitans arboris TaxID=2691583 RepID=A0A845SBB7_9GAMM|nr:transcriptional repressor AgaR [Acerihabitans arboris]NDL61209.1 DeoR family transcriptional regulator [Acerihabitans arboris]